MKFRTDINGLRAIAVIAVVLFHFNPAWVPGGFAGVDVFFVISGFLMTAIIFRGIEQNNFSIVKFYISRANRIIPALAVLCSLLLIFGFFYILPLDYKILGKHIRDSITFISNITYWKESGYFDADSHEKWLLHTWSLSVEWQFYLIYPLVLLVLKRFLSLVTIKRFVILSMLLSFVGCIITTQISPNTGFYLLPARAWEMLFGGIAFLYPLQLRSEKSKRLLEYLGLTLIFTSYIFISKENLWPGYLAMIPVMGAFLLIQANRDDSFITNNVFSQKIGKWSYSIYLYHWPIVVAITYYSLESQFIYYGILLSVLLGFLSFKYIESIKLRNNFTKAIEYVKCKPLILVIVIYIFAAFVYKTMPNNFLNPVPKNILATINLKNYACFDKKYQHTENSEFCTLAKGEKNIFAFGDSHSNSSLPVVEYLAKENGVGLTYAGYSGCPPLLGVYPIRHDQQVKNCKVLNDKVFSYIKSHNIDTVFLAARWTYYTEGTYQKKKMQFLSYKKDHTVTKEESIEIFKAAVNRTFAEYNTLGIPVVVMLQVPMQKILPAKRYYKSLQDKHISLDKLNDLSVTKVEHLNFQTRTNNIIKNIASKYANIYIVDPTSAFCKHKYCLAGDSKASYYVDYDHLSIQGSMILKDLLKPYIQ